MFNRYVLHLLCHATKYTTDTLIRVLVIVRSGFYGNRCTINNLFIRVIYSRARELWRPGRELKRLVANASSMSLPNLSPIRVSETAG